ncbi:hypothetical protein [Cupriavidus sp. USMAHM13]|uniref:hypothetical protein n=1 Tax=Cupriavidus sp. USMAHM13 TaxID=1389192 RepID=UPI0012EA982C|nr:hypothetical protein [Cupriavidus sp. USMAHM13]
MLSMARAQGSERNDEGENGRAALAEKRFGDIRYMSGGADREEQIALLDATRGYGLCLAYLNRFGAGLAGVETRIYRVSGRLVFHAVSSGPLLLVRLQAGSYWIIANSGGEAVAMPVTIHSRMRAARQVRWLRTTRLQV